MDIKTRYPLPYIECHITAEFLSKRHKSFESVTPCTGIILLTSKIQEIQTLRWTPCNISPVIQDNIKMDLQEMGGGWEDWMELAQDRDKWRALMSTVMNLRVPKMRGISWLAAEPVSFSRRTLLHGVSKYIGCIVSKVVAALVLMKVN